MDVIVGGRDAGAPVQPELGRRCVAEFIEHAVELGKAGEAAVRRDVCDFHIRVQQKLLGVAHTRHLDVIDEREAP